MKYLATLMLATVFVAAFADPVRLHHLQRREVGDNEPTDTITACSIVTDPGTQNIKIASISCARNVGINVNTAFLDEHIKEEQFSDANPVPHHEDNTEGLARLIHRLGVPQVMRSAMRDCLINTLTKDVEEFITQHETAGDLKFNDRQTLSASFTACKDQVPIDVCYHEACVNAITFVKPGLFFIA